MPGKPSADRPLCRDTTARGTPCKNKAAAGSAFCGSHGGGQRKPGAPTKLTRELAASIAADVATGVTYEVAASAAGVHRSSLIEWRGKGEEDLEANRDTVFAYFAVELTRALARGELELVRKITSDPDWRAAAHVLACRYPSRWAKRPTAEDEESSERAKPRTVEPVADRRDEILGILGRAMAPPPSDVAA